MDKPDSSIPKDKTPALYSEALQVKAERYLVQQQDMKDEYGLLLPKNWDGTPREHGDALMWNSIALASMCLIDDTENDFGIMSLFEAYQQLQAEDGRLFRHPTIRESNTRTTISKDQITGFLYLAKTAKDTECIISGGIGSMLQRFAEYARLHKWQIGVGKTDITTTYWTDRHLLKKVLQLYGLDTSGLDLKTSIHDTKGMSYIADDIFYTHYKCRKDGGGYCEIAKGTSVFPAHLAFLSAMIMGEVSSLKELAKVGDNIGFNNWLFVTGYRTTQKRKTFNDVEKFLVEDFPDDLPNEINGVKGWGCTDYIWQRAPLEKCDNDTRTNIGNDLIHVYALIQFYKRS